MGFLRAMDEGKYISRRMAISSIVLITLLALTALYVPRREHFGVQAEVTVTPLPVTAGVELWLSTADRRLRLA
jgi:glucosylceramidase